MALATNKRRFYNLLDNLSSPKVNTQSPSTSAAADRPAKRTRMPHSVPLTVKTVTRPLSTSIRVLAGGSTTTTTRIGKGDAVSAGTTYAPWSQEQFLNRLETFADVKVWTTKPEPLSEVYWANRGWVVAGVDEVACRSCGKHMLVKIGGSNGDGEEKDGEEEQDWWREGMEQDYIDRYAALIVDSHSQDCLWRKAGCKDDIYRIKFSDSAQWQAELVERFNSLITSPSSLPLHISNPIQAQETDSNKADLAVIVNYFTRSKSSSKQGNRSPTTAKSSSDNSTSLHHTLAQDHDRISSAAILAVCGWKARNQTGVHIASCQICFARVGLWLYSNSSSPKSPSDPVNDQDATDSISMKFDPITLHRTHCPWQNPTSQSGLGVYSGHAAWEILVELLGLEASRDVRRRSIRVEEVVPVEQYRSEHESEEEQLPVSRASREETDRQDKERETRLERLKRAFTTKNTIKKAPRPISSRSTTSFLSGKSFHRRGRSRDITP